MSGDWLKIEKHTPDKPEVLLAAKLLGLSGSDAFLACFRIWAWADSHTVNGVLPLTLEQVSALSLVPGFANVLVQVGWLTQRNGAFEIPNFDHHMGQSAKKRAKDARRKKYAYVSGTSPPEKRRKAGGKPSAILLSVSPPSSKPSLEEVRKFCADRKSPIDPEEFWNHYQANGWVQGRNKPIKDWKAAVVTWEKRVGQFGRNGAVAEPPQLTRAEAAAKTERTIQSLKNRLPEAEKLFTEGKHS